MAERSRHIKTRELVSLIVVILFAVVFLFPVVWMFVTSIRTTHDLYHYPPSVLPGVVTWGNYTYVFTGIPDFLRYFVNSAVVTTGTVLLVVFSGMSGGYAFGMRRFIGRDLLFMAIVLVLTVPYIMYLIPIYIMEDTLGITNTWIGLILPYTAIDLPWGLLILRGAFSTIPREMRDAAVIEGAGEFRMWWSVFVPMVKPAIATTTIITFIFAWQEYMFASTLMTSNYWQTLPVGIVFIEKQLQTLVMGRIGAMVVATIVPVLIVFIVFRRFFVEGLSEGMLKG